MKMLSATRCAVVLALTALWLAFSVSSYAKTLTLTCASDTGEVGVEYDSALVASGGSGRYTFSITRGELPPGLKLDASTGEISGTPTSQGTYSYTAKVVDSRGDSATANCKITIRASANPIKHVVIIFQENRSTDDLFQDPVLIGRGAEIASSGKTSSGKTVQLKPAPLANDWDMGHNHHDFLTSWDGGAMDGFDLDQVFCPEGQQDCAPTDPEYYYVQSQDVQPYFTLAETYTFADHMFQTNQGPSFPAHQYIISGTSALAKTGVYDMSDNPTGGGNQYGCIAPPSAYVKLINTQTGDESQTAYPCSEHATLTDLLDKSQLSWKYYTPDAGNIWTGPVAIEHICGPNQPPPNGTECVAQEWTDHVVLEGQNSQILTDIAAGQLAAVSWVIPNGAASDHPGGNDGSGPSWVAAIVNAIGESQYWANTAILIAWDDWGGWYDHMPPPQPFYNAYEIGFRVPMIVVSPYAKTAYISKDQHDFGSILHFIETTFGLGYVDGDQYADARADDLSDCFDFSQKPLQFEQIKAPLPASHFLNNSGPPLPPDDD